MGKNDSRVYSYWFDRLAVKMYDFRDKELCLRHYIAYMLNRTQKIFKYEGLPDTIPKRMLEYMLQVNGFACFAEFQGDLYAFYGGLGGEPDAYYRPTKCVVANSALKFDKTFEIDKDCVIVRNDSYLYGLMPLFRRYASAMVENDISFRMASINTRIESLLSAPDDTTKDAAEKYLRDVEDGKLGVIASNEFLEGIKAQPMTTSLRTFTDLIEYQQYLKASWFNEIGLNANYNMKREKLSTTESQMNNDALLPLVDDMLESRQVCLDKVNAMFGTNIKVSFASSWEKLIEEFQAEIDDLRMMDDESNQLDGGEDNGTTDSAGSAVDVPEVHDNSSGEELRENGTSEETDASDDSGVTDGDDAEVSDEVGDTDDGTAEVTVEVNVNINTDEEREDDAEGQAESDESVRDNDTDE